MSDETKMRRTRQISVQVEPDLKARFQDLCFSQDPKTTVSLVMRSLVEGWVRAAEARAIAASRKAAVAVTETH